MLEGERGLGGVSGGGGGRLGRWRKAPQVRAWWVVGAQPQRWDGGRELCLWRGTAGPSSPGGGQLQGGLEGDQILGDGLGAFSVC